jgi:Fe-S oxidoreductase
VCAETYCCGGVATKGFKQEEFEKKPPSVKETNWYDATVNCRINK